MPPPPALHHLPPPSSARPSHLIQQPFVPAPPTPHRCTVYLPAFRKVSSFLVGRQLRGQRAEHSPLPRGLPPDMLSGALETQCLALRGCQVCPKTRRFFLSRKEPPLWGGGKGFCFLHSGLPGLPCQVGSYLLRGPSDRICFCSLPPPPPQCFPHHFSVPS